MIGARSGDQFGANSSHSVYCLRRAFFPSARRFPRVERDAPLAPPYWIFTRWKNIFMSNADTFTMFVIVAKIEMTFERVLVRLPTEKKRPVVVKNFNVKENIFRGFSLGKTLRKRPLCISVDLPILVSEFVSHRPPIIFESSESVIVWWSSSVLNGIFSRLNLKFAIKTRNQTFGNWRKSVKVVRTSLSLKWEKYEKAFKFAESCRKSWKVKAEPWSRTLIGEKLDKFQLFTHPNNPTNFRSSNISKVHHQREIFRRFRHDRKFSFSRESKKKKIIVKRVFSPKENWSWNCFRGCVCARSSAVLVHSIGDCANESEKKRKDFSDQHTQVQNIWMNFPTFSSICYVWGKIYFPIWWILSFVYSPRWW